MSALRGLTEGERKAGYGCIQPFRLSLNPVFSDYLSIQYSVDDLDTWRCGVQLLYLDFVHVRFLDFSEAPRSTKAVIFFLHVSPLKECWYIILFL